MRLEKHEFGDGTLHGGVETAGDPRFLQMIASAVARHLHLSLQTLTDIHNHFSVASTFFKKPLRGRMDRDRAAHLVVADGGAVRMVLRADDDGG